MNEELYEQLLNAAAVLVGVEEYRKKDRALVEKQEKSAMIMAGKKARIGEDTKYSGNARGWGIFLSIVSGVVSFPFLILLIGGGFDEFFREGGYGYLAVLYNCAFAHFGGIAFIVTSCIAKAHHREHCQEEYNQYVIEHNKLMRNLRETHECILKDLDAFLEQETHFLEVVPSKYRHMDAVIFMLECVKNLRALNLTDAINLYETELHQRSLRGILQSAAEQQKLMHEQTMLAMAEIQSNQERVHNDLQAVTALQVADMIFRKS